VIDDPQQDEHDELATHSMTRTPEP
jgi:hypothetical protein